MHSRVCWIKHSWNYTAAQLCWAAQVTGNMCCIRVDITHELLVLYLDFDIIRPVYMLCRACVSGGEEQWVLCALPQHETWSWLKQGVLWFPPGKVCGLYRNLRPPFTCACFPKVDVQKLSWRHFWHVLIDSDMFFIYFISPLLNYLYIESLLMWA